MRISKYKNNFSKGYTLSRSEEAFLVNKVNNTVLWTYFIEDLQIEEVLVAFYEKELQMTNHVEFRIERVRKRKGHRFHFKWKGYDNSFSSWI